MYVCFKKMQLNFDERDKYVNEHKNKYKKLYEDELSDYGFEIEFLY